MLLKDLFYFKDMYSKKEVVELFNDFDMEYAYVNGGKMSYTNADFNNFLKEKGLINEKSDYKIKIEGEGIKTFEVTINGETYIKK